MRLSAAFLRAAYRQLPAPVRTRVPLGVEAWLRGTAMPRLTGIGPVGSLDARLWGGFSQPAGAELVAIAGTYMVADDFPRELIGRAVQIRLEKGKLDIAALD